VTVTARPVPRFEWERVIRRADLPLGTKGIALLLATWADEDGTNVRPGEERLARVSGINPRNARRHVTKLRSLGLLILVSRADRFRKLADMHRLAVPVTEDGIAALGLLDPNERHRSLVTSDPVDNSGVTGQQGPVTEGDTPDGARRSPVTGDAITGLSATGSPVTSDLPPTHLPTTDQPIDLSSPSDVQSAVDSAATTNSDFDYSTAQQIVQAALGIEQAAARIRELTADGTDYTAAMVTLAHQIGDKPA
jgi:hypothetical protein